VITDIAGIKPLAMNILFRVEPSEKLSYLLRLRNKYRLIACEGTNRSLRKRGKWQPQKDYPYEISHRSKLKITFVIRKS
jgi:hypothetical protein